MPDHVIHGPFLKTSNHENSTCEGDAGDRQQGFDGAALDVAQDYARGPGELALHPQAFDEARAEERRWLGPHRLSRGQAYGAPDGQEGPDQPGGDAKEDGEL